MTVGFGVTYGCRIFKLIDGIGVKEAFREQFWGQFVAVVTVAGERKRPLLPRKKVVGTFEIGPPTIAMCHTRPHVHIVVRLRIGAFRLPIVLIIGRGILVPTIVIDVPCRVPFVTEFGS